ncbi:uncharacterized protein [Procambarus clarkii]|uniref:uncharacterized protein n=1 Tax=Procambarus clarkii TaxID=6728 RepID=UPI00374434BB
MEKEEIGLWVKMVDVLGCVVEASPDINTTHQLINNFESLANISFSQLSENEIYWQLMNSSLWKEMNQTLSEGGVGGRALEECLAPRAADRPYLLPWWQQLSWSLAFGPMLLIAVGGNAIVMWIVIAHRRMRTVTNYFLVNLSVADLMMSVFNCIFNFIYMLHSDWPFGSTYCTISNFLANVTISASVFTLMAISLDRYIAIVRPLKPRMTKSEALKTIVVIWVSSLTLAVPCLLYSTTVSIRYNNNEVRRGCFLLWPDGKTSVSYSEYVYNTVFFTTTYMLPMLVMLVSYSLIGCELWGSRSIGEMNARHATSIKSKKRVVRMFLVIVVLFMLCWLPQQGFFLYQYHNSQVLDTKNIQHIYLGFYWLAMANAMVNPVIYYWMNTRFRSYFREVVLQCCLGRRCRCCCCCCWGVKSSRLLHSPGPAPRRHDSLELTSRSRTNYRPDTNVEPRTSAVAGSGHHHRLQVYSAKNKLRNQDGAVHNQHRTKTGGEQNSVDVPKLRFETPSERKCSRQPIRDEGDMHSNLCLPAQHSIKRLKTHQTSTKITSVNGLKVFQNCLIDNDPPNEQCREHVEMTRLAPDDERVGDVIETSNVSSPTEPSSEILFNISQTSGALTLVPVTYKIQVKSKSLCGSHNDSTFPKQIIFGKTAVSINKFIGNGEFLQNFLPESSSASRTDPGNHPYVKTSGNLVQQAIEEMLQSATKQSHTSDYCGIQKKDLSFNPVIGLNASKEIML